MVITFNQITLFSASLLMFLLSKLLDKSYMNIMQWGIIDKWNDIYAKKTFVMGTILYHTNLYELKRFTDTSNPHLKLNYTQIDNVK